MKSLVRLFIHRYQITSVSIELMDRFIQPKLRSRRFETIEMVANLGGIFGLFLNISLINFIEMIIFLIIRPICNCIFRYRNKEPKSNDLYLE